MVGMSMSILLSSPVQLPEPFQYEFYDPVHQHFLLLTGSGYFYIYSLVDDSPAPKLFFHDPELPAKVLYARISLSKALIAVQVTLISIIIIDTLQPGRKWIIDLKSSPDSCILNQGLIWSDHGGSSEDLVIVVPRGLELYKISMKKNYCKLSRSISQPLVFFWYSPEHRMILTANYHKKSSFSSVISGRTGKEVVALDGVYLKSEKSSLPTLELPLPDKIPRFELDPGIKIDHIFLESVYGLDLVLIKTKTDDKKQLVVYNISKTSVEKVAILLLDINVGPIAISSYDNLLLVHDREGKTTSVFDIFKSPQISSSASKPPYEPSPFSIDSICPPLMASFTSAHIQEIAANSSLIPKSSYKGYPSVKHFSSLIFSEKGAGNGDPKGIDSPRGRYKEYTEVDVPIPAAGFYTTDFALQSSKWAVHKGQRVIWQVVCDPYMLSLGIPDHKEKAAFLQRRGRVYHSVHREISSHPIVNRESKEGKYSILRMYQDVLERKLDPLNLRVCFDFLAQSYINEAVRVKATAASQGSAMRDKEVADSEDFELLSVLNVSGKSRQNDNYQDSPVMKAYLSMESLSGKSGKRLSLRNSLGLPSNKENGSNNIIAGDPLEPSGITHFFLADITSIIAKVKASGSGNNVTLSSSVGLNLQHLPISLRRDEKGNLITSQVEVLSYVWIPLFLSESVDFSYYTQALSLYISSFSDQSVDVTPPLCMLHASLLFHLGRVNELCNLLGISFYSDSTDFALTLLQFSGTMMEEVSLQTLRKSQSLSGLNEELFQYKLTSFRETIQSHGLAMLWRSGDKATVVKWYLTQGDVSKAMQICLPYCGSWDKGLLPGSISGAEFFISAVNTINRMARSSTGNDGSSKLDMGQLLTSLHCFLLQWDPDSITDQAVSRCRSI